MKRGKHESPRPRRAEEATPRPTDPPVERAVDAALAPERAGMRGALPKEIGAVTRPHLPPRGARTRARKRRRLRQAAAVALLAVEAGIWATLVGIADDARALARADAELTEASSYGGPDAPIDRRIRRLQRAMTRFEGGDWVGAPGAVGGAGIDAERAPKRDEKAKEAEGAEEPDAWYRWERP
jgi:hypothetical protein